MALHLKFSEADVIVVLLRILLKWLAATFPV